MIYHIKELQDYISTTTFVDIELQQLKEVMNAMKAGTRIDPSRMFDFERNQIIQRSDHDVKHLLSLILEKICQESQEATRFIEKLFGIVFTSKKQWC